MQSFRTLSFCTAEKSVTVQTKNSKKNTPHTTVWWDKNEEKCHKPAGNSSRLENINVFSFFIATL